MFHKERNISILVAKGPQNLVYGHNENGIKMVENIRRLRLGREDVWMKTLRIFSIRTK